MRKIKIRTAKEYFGLLKDSAAMFFNKDMFSQAAGLSYYSIFALPAMLVVVISSSALLFSKADIEGFIFNTMSSIFGNSSAETLFTALEASGVFQGTIWTNLINIGILIFTSTTVLVTIQGILNNIFHAEFGNDDPWYKFLIDRIFSFSLLLGFAFLLIISLVVNAFITAFGETLSKHIPDFVLIFGSVINFLLPLVIIGFLLGVIFQYMPNRRIPWRVALEGGILTTILLSLGKLGIGFYIGKSSTHTLYAAAGDVLIIMIWIFYASAIFLFGACYTAALLKRHLNKKQEKELALTAIQKEIILS